MDTNSVCSRSCETNSHHYQVRSLVSSPSTSHWPNGTKLQLHLVVTNCHPGDLPLGIHSPEDKTLSSIWHGTFLPWHINTKCGSLREPLLSKNKDPWHCLLTSEINWFTFTQWPTGKVALSASFSCGLLPRGTLLWRKHGRQTLEHSILTFSSEDQAAAECTKAAWHYKNRNCWHRKGARWRGMKTFSRGVCQQKCTGQTL